LVGQQIKKRGGPGGLRFADRFLVGDSLSGQGIDNHGDLHGEVDGGKNCLKRIVSWCLCNLLAILVRFWKN
jgi:hypothetical protein